VRVVADSVPPDLEAIFQSMLLIVEDKADACRERLTLSKPDCAPFLLSSVAINTHPVEIAVFNPEPPASGDEIGQSADEVLYASKRDGRNRVTLTLNQRG